MEKINALGLTCPIPVVKAKKALAAIDGKGEILISVDNKTSTENLKKLAKTLKCDIEITEVSADCYDVLITKKENFENDSIKYDETIVVISGDKMGEGDEELGRSLMKAFIYALTEAETVPQKIIFYNSGAKLSVEGSASLDDLKALEKKGVQILTCGACLNYYKITDKLAVGEVTNMYSILECMNEAGKIIKP